jgi:hypothetical protein
MALSFWKMTETEFRQILNAQETIVSCVIYMLSAARSQAGMGYGINDTNRASHPVEMPQILNMIDIQLRNHSPENRQPSSIVNKNVARGSQQDGILNVILLPSLEIWKNDMEYKDCYFIACPSVVHGETNGSKSAEFQLSRR